MTRPHSPLPDLERELVAAAKRREAARAPKRRAWLHGWALVAAVVATTSVAGVAAARVAEVGPFAYLNRFTDHNPRLAPVTTISVDAGGEDPAWRATAVIDTLGRICITGGPRDARTNPTAPPTTDLNNPPASVYACSASDSLAEMLADPTRPGSTFAEFSVVGGTDNATAATGSDGGERRTERQQPTQMLVYALAQSGMTPVVRWRGTDEQIAMKPSQQHLDVTVDRAPEGLSQAEQAKVATYPEHLDVVLWGTLIEVPEDARDPQLLVPGSFKLDDVPDDVIEVAGFETVKELISAQEREGWKPAPGISRNPQPVKRESAATRKALAAFARPRNQGDAVPSEQRPPFYAEYQRAAWNASRRLSIAGGGLRSAAIVPGGLREDEVFDLTRSNDLICMVGSPLLGQCKYGVGDWKLPLVEAVTCARNLTKGETFIWALTPAGATKLELLDDEGGADALPLAELVALRRPMDEQPAAIRWTLAEGKTVSVKVPWPQQKPNDCASPTSTGFTDASRDSLGGTATSGGVDVRQLPAMGND